MDWIFWIGLSLSLMIFTAKQWKEDKRKHYFELDLPIWACLSFLGCPIVSFVVVFLVEVIVWLFGLWLVPFIIVVIGFLSYIYYDEIKEKLEEFK